MFGPALKCENIAIFKQNYNLTLFIAVKMASSCCLSLGGNLDFLDFLQKKSTTEVMIHCLDKKALHLILGHALVDGINVLKVVSLGDFVYLSSGSRKLLSDVLLVVNEFLKSVHHLVTRVASALLVVVPEHIMVI